MSKFLIELTETDCGDSRYFRLHEPLIYECDIIKDTIEVPIGFIYDHESVPLLKGSCNHAGCIHDYVCRKDNKFKDKVTLQIAASIYLEAMKTRNNTWWKRYIKGNFVRLNWCHYWHRWSVNSTYDEIKGNIA